MQQPIINELLQKIKSQSHKLELYIVTEENLNLNNEKYMIGCFYSYEKSKSFFYYKKSKNNDYNFRYEIKMVQLTKDKYEKLLLYDDIYPNYKTITIPNILKYLTNCDL
tara:strand:- start:492 stop:818 length:327 start_codon:yes stop_codon:yes gene_type:complete